jgi:hypothetical protein
MSEGTLRDHIFSRHVLPACATGVALAFLAGCGGGGKTDDAPSTPPPSTTAASTPTPDRTAEAKTDAAAAYVQMWDASAAAFHAGKVTSPELEKWAVDKALANQEAAGLYYQGRGTIMQGKPSLSPTVTSVEFTETPYTANITDCMDTTHYIEVSKKTGKPVGGVDPQKHHVATAVARFNGKSWVISEVAIDRDRTC